MSSAAAAKVFPSSEKSVVTQTLPGVCLAAILRHNKPDAVSDKRGEHWVHISATEFVRRVRHVALSLGELGIHRGDRVALISENRAEWSIVDFAILCIGAITVPIYTTQAVDQIEFILKDSGARALLISGGRVLRHAHKGFESSDQLEKVIVFDSEDARGLARAIALETIEARGAEIERDDPQAFERLIRRGSPDDSLFFTRTSHSQFCRSRTFSSAQSSTSFVTRGCR